MTEWPLHISGRTRQFWRDYAKAAVEAAAPLLRTPSEQQAVRKAIKEGKEHG